MNETLLPSENQLDKKERAAPGCQVADEKWQHSKMAALPLMQPN
jgi:hypothetical protein